MATLLSGSNGVSGLKFSPTEPIVAIEERVRQITGIRRLGETEVMKCLKMGQGRRTGPASLRGVVWSDGLLIETGFAVGVGNGQGELGSAVEVNVLLGAQE